MAQEKEEKTAGQEKAEKGKRKINFSVDDFFTAFIDLTGNRKEYSSLFEQPVFAFLNGCIRIIRRFFPAFVSMKKAKTEGIWRR
ncbi:MAG: hypothetical protein ACLVLH_18415 [Eisenbergiella massiliensis]